MTAFTTQNGDALGADKIARSATAYALYNNPIAIAERGSGAPVVQVPVREYKTTGTAATWTIPAGVSAFNVIVIGGGGGTGTGGNGGSSSVTYDSVTVTAGGGTGVAGGGGGGTATGGDLNIDGQQGDHSPDRGGISPLGFGSSLIAGTATAPGAGGSSATPGQGGGGGGAGVIKRYVVVSGQTTATYTVGAGGNGSIADGGPGLVIFEY